MKKFTDKTFYLRRKVEIKGSVYYEVLDCGIPR